MELCTCRECRRLFYNVYDTPVCQDCRQVIEEKYQEVKEYLREHSGAGMAQILEDCDVKKSYIIQWVKEGQLELAEGQSGIRCDGCGGAVQSGRFCRECKLRFLNEWNRQQFMEKKEKKEKTVEKDSNARMRHTRREH